MKTKKLSYLAMENHHRSFVMKFVIILECQTIAVVVVVFDFLHWLE